MQRSEMTIFPASKAGRTSRCMWSRRSAAKRRARVAESTGVVALSCSRIIRPMGPREGSQVVWTLCPKAVRAALKALVWVDVPLPSIPSRAMWIPVVQDMEEIP